MGQLFTVGHSTNEKEHFLKILKQNNVEYILDVRSTPYSRHAPQYNREELNAYLKANGIQYAHMGRHFGARQSDPALYNEAGYLDFERVRVSENFIKGKENVKLGLKKFNIALMCTEKHPIDCHRAIMVARGFELDDIPVQHILNDGSLLSQGELNQMLLDRYFPNRNQMTIFQCIGEVQAMDDSDNLKEAYRKRNSEIGYHIERRSEGGIE